MATTARTQWRLLPGLEPTPTPYRLPVHNGAPRTPQMSGRAATATQLRFTKRHRANIPQAAFNLMKGIVFSRTNLSPFLQRACRCCESLNTSLHKHAGRERLRAQVRGGIDE